jgi:hypothetical protein
VIATSANSAASFKIARPPGQRRFRSSLQRMRDA